MTLRARVTRLSRFVPFIAVAELSTLLGWSVPGAEVRRVNDPLVPGGAVVTWAHSPDGTRVLYSASQVTAGVNEIFDVPLDGSQASRLLSAPLLPGRNIDGFFRLTAGGSRIVYRADHDTDEQLELYSVPTDGSRIATKLNGALDAQVDVYDFTLTPDGAWVVFRRLIQAGNVRISSAPVDGSQPAVDLSSSIPWSVLKYQITSDSSSVVVHAGSNIYSLPIDGSASAQQLDGSMIAGADWVCTPDDGHVVFLSGFPNDFTRGLYCAPLDGSSAPLELVPPLPNFPGTPGREWRRLEITPDSERVVGVYDGELYSARLDGLEPAVQLSDAATYVWDFRIGPARGHGYQIVYSVPGGPSGLHSVPVDGSASPVQLITSPATMRVPEFAAGDRVVSVTAESGSFELHGVRLDGNHAQDELSGPMVAGGGVGGGALYTSGYFFLSPDRHWALYRADQEVDEQVELYCAPTDGRFPATKISGAMPPTGDVYHLTFVPGRRELVFMATTDGPAEIFTTSFGSDARPKAVDGPPTSSVSVDVP